MENLWVLKAKYGHFLFALSVFGSAIDTSIGLNFLLLFLLITWSGAVFSKSTAQTKLPFSQKIVCLIFAAVYALFILSEAITVANLDEVLAVVVNYSAVGLLGVVVLSCIKHRITFDSISPWIGIVAILYAVIAFVELYSEQTMRVSFGYNSIPLGMISVQLMFWCGCAALKSDNASPIVLIGIVCAFWVVFLSGSRMPVAVAFYLLVLWTFFTKQPAYIRFFVLIGCALIVPLQMILIPESTGVIFSRFAAFDIAALAGTDAEAKPGSGLHRSWIWRAGWELMSQQPWFGWGRNMAPTEQVLAAIQAPEAVIEHPHFHNELINIAVRFGVPAAILLTFSYAALFWTSPTRHHFWVAFVFLSQLFALSLTDIIFSHSVTLSMFVFTVTLLLLYNSPNVTGQSK